MKRTRTLRLSLTLLLAAACAPSAQDSGLAQAWIDAPLDGSHIADAPYEIVGHASHSTGVSHFELQIGDGAPELILPAAENGALAQMQKLWQPPGPGTYLIQLRAAHNDSDYGPAAEALVIVDGAPAPDEEPAEEGTETPTSSPTPTTGPLTVIAIPLQNVNCRLGASSSQFDIVDTLFEGVEYSPAARGFDNQWVRFVGPVANINCWVFAGNLSFFINEEEVAELADVSEELLPYAGYPATPTPSPTSVPPTVTPTPSVTPTSTRTPVLVP